MNILQQKVTLIKSDKIVKDGTVNVKLNLDAIDNDIARLKESHDTKKIYDKTNIKAIIKYLYGLMDYLNEEDELEITWEDKNGQFRSKSELLKIPEYGIDMTNYIMTGENEVVVEVDLLDLANIIAFEISHRDSGYGTSQVEGYLDRSGAKLISPNESSILTDLFKEYGLKPLKSCQTLSIKDSPYLEEDKKYIFDYFITHKYARATKYKDVVNDSCKYCMDLVVANTVEKLIDKKDIEHYIKVVSIDTNSITFITNCESLKIKNCIESVTVRSFGRIFKVVPRITIY